jgi:hypothetical protein
MRVFGKNSFRFISTVSLIARLTLLVLVPGLLIATAAFSQARLVRSVEGTSQLDNCALGLCSRPPQTMGAVGTTQFIEASQSSVAIYAKTSGNLLSRVSLPAFWVAAGVPSGGNAYPRLLFDHYTNRWVIAGLGGAANTINIAVSASADASGSWRGHVINVLPSGTADFPTLSMDDKAVYLSTNNFTPGFSGTSLLVFPKPNLYAGTPTWTTFNTLTTGLDNGFAIQTALNWQGNASNTAAVVADSRDADNNIFYKLNGVDSAIASQTPSAVIAGTNYVSVSDAAQPDGTRLIPTLSARITANAIQVNGKVYFVTSVRSSIGNFSAVRWHVVDANNGTLLGSGLIEQTGYDYFQGTIAVNEFGEALMAYNRSGTAVTDGNGDGFPDGNISLLARPFAVSGNTLVSAGAELLLRVSPISDYRCGERSVFDTICRQRWGDYAAISMDPNDHHRFYAFGEYATSWSVIPALTTTPRAIWKNFISEIEFVSFVRFSNGFE